MSTEPDIKRQSSGIIPGSSLNTDVCDVPMISHKGDEQDVSSACSAWCKMIKKHMIQFYLALLCILFLSFSTMFLEHCGRCESLGTTTCLAIVVGISKGMLSVKYFHSKKASFCVS